ncbi:hypothetical protein H1R20_g9621, partial [Candolleomyces eurysporus]
MDESTNQQDSSPLLQLPTDILLIIVEQLGLDILFLRLCCRKALELTQERSLWVRTIKKQQQELSIPPEVIQRVNSDESLRDMPTEELFKLALPWKGLVAELEDFDHGPWVSFAAAADPESHILILSTAKLVPYVICPQLAADVY